MKASRFQDTTPFQERLELCNSQLQKHPDRIVIIVEPYLTTDPPINHKRFLVNRDRLASKSIGVIKERIDTKPTMVLRFYVVTNTKPYAIVDLLSSWYTSLTGYIVDPALIYLPIGYHVGTIYDNYKHDDGFLYIVYTVENILPEQPPEVPVESK